MNHLLSKILLLSAAFSALGLFQMQRSAVSDSIVPPTVQQAFQSWKSAHGKTYMTPAEEIYRLKVYFANYLEVMGHTETTYQVKLNLFADLTAEEFLSKHTGLSLLNQNSRQEHIPQSLQQSTPPATWDWRTQGAVNPIRNQGSCESCWAFSAVASFESAAKIAKFPLYSFSEQQLVDCSRPASQSGCKHGGLMDDAFKYIISWGGLESEAQYPYTGADQNCKAVKGQQQPPKIISFTDIPLTSSQSRLRLQPMQSGSMLAVSSPTNTAERA
jgi:KDEL-tailed cysteine endopeptidase